MNNWQKHTGTEMPTPEMIEAAAQRLVRWEDGCTWPDSWDALTVAAARLDAERALRSGLNVAPRAPLARVVGRIQRDSRGRHPSAVINSAGRKLPDGAALYSIPEPPEPNQ